MAQDQADAIEVLENVYAKVVSKPTIDMTTQEIESRGEVVHDISLTILQVESADMQKLHEAMATRQDEMQNALTTLEKATTESTDYLTMVEAVDQALQIVSSFFLFLL
jgi:hypothetical protein